MNVAYATVSTNTTTNHTGSSTVAYTYNGLGEVLSKTEATGDVTNYTYDAGGRQTAIDEGSFTLNGTTIQLHTTQDYDGLGDLVFTKEYDADHVAETHITSYVYGAGGRLISVTDPTLFTRTFSYDAMGRTVLTSYQRLHSDGTYSTDGDVTFYDKLGRATSQGTATENGATWSLNDMQGAAYDAFGDVVAKSINGVTQQTYAYDNAGRMWKSTDEGIVTLYLYDANGNQTLSVTSDGNALASGSWGNFSEVAGQPSGSVSYVAAMGTIGSTIVQGMVETITVYDGRNQAIQVREPNRQLAAGGAATLLTSAKTYNAFGEVASEKDFNLNTTTYTYNTMGRITQEVMPQVSTTDATGATTSANPTLNNFTTSPDA